MVEQMMYNFYSLLLVQKIYDKQEKPILCYSKRSNIILGKQKNDI